MQSQEFLLVFLAWIAAYAPALVMVLVALVPVMALAIAGYALHVVSKKGGRK